MAFPIEPSKTALLIMDYQPSILANQPAETVSSLLQNAAKALAAARKAGVRIIYVVIGFRAGYPELSPNNKFFWALKSSQRFLPDSPGTGIHPDVAPQPEDLIITKKRISAYAGSDLDLLLRAGGIDTLVLAGVATSGVVLSTVRQAADLDLRLAVLKDACADADPEVHAVLLGKVFPRQAEVMDVAAFVESLA